MSGDLIDYYTREGAQIVVLSEYGIGAVSRPVHLNRRLREAGLIAIRDELGHDVLDPGESTAFAVADHQVAHVYISAFDARGGDSDPYAAVLHCSASTSGCQW